MVAKQLSIYGILTSIYKIYLVMPAPPQFPDVPPPIPVQTFGMGIGSNPNLSRQSRRLYISSITSDVNEQNLTDFFNSKMIEMSIGTGGPGKPVLAVQCNYEKNYAFVEVGDTAIWLNPVTLT